jgi:predicted transcriptional regulator of viral defense system
MNLKYSDVQAGVGQAERHVLDAMSRIGKPVIRAGDLENELGFTRAVSNLMLSRLCKKGWVQRLRSGIYRLVPLGSESANPIPEDAWAIAVELFSPCYISGWTAAEHWELTEQIFNSTVVFTTQKQRKKELVISGLKYRTKSIAPNDVFGTKKIWSSNTQIQIADLHRTIIDVLDDPVIGGGGRHTVDILKEYFQHKEANPEILCQYAEKLGHGAVFKRLGFIAETLKQFPLLLLERLHSNIKTGIINLDPHGSSSGSIITKWGIRVNIPLGDLV